MNPTQPRDPAGTPSGGRFGPVTNPEADDVSIEDPDPSGMQDIIAALRQMEDGTPISWGELGETYWGAHLATLDIQVPEIEEAAKLAWVWTINAPESYASDEERDALPPTEILIPYDRTIVTAGETGVENVVGVVKRDDPDHDDTVRALAAEHGRTSTGLGWATETITAAVDGWCEEHAGKKLAWSYDPKITIDDIAELRSLLDGHFDTGGLL